MKVRLSIGAAVALAAAYAFVSPAATLAADGPSLLGGKVVSAAGEALAGIPIKAHRDNSAVTVAVYTDAKGEYSFPAWSDLTPGAYSVGIELPDFEHTDRKSTRLNSSHQIISYAVFCLKKKKQKNR